LSRAEFFLRGVFIFINIRYRESNKETVMQERYCDCGRKVLVRFVHTPVGWAAVIEQRNRPLETTTSCPACGRRLDIHALR
jgi:hypothetical protein